VHVPVGQSRDDNRTLHVDHRGRPARERPDLPVIAEAADPAAGRGQRGVRQLSLGQALAVIVAGNLFWAVVGLLAVSGPAPGTPSEVIMRAMFGIRGNRVNIAITGWFACVCYLALNWAAASLAAFSLAADLGAAPGTAAKVAIIVTIAAVTLAISVYGHATIVKLYLPFTVVLTAVFVVLAGYVLTRAQWGYRPAHPLHGTLLCATLAGALALVASAPLSYNNSADFSRYLPRRHPARLGRGVDGARRDPARLVPARVPAGRRAGHGREQRHDRLQLGPGPAGRRRPHPPVPQRRPRGTLGVAVTLYALLVSNFLDTMASMLQVMVALLGPSMAIYATDILLRRNRYDGRDLSDQTRTGPFWYTGGVNWPARPP
jgi:purine-cytosine permease-like protein